MTEKKVWLEQFCKHYFKKSPLLGGIIRENASVIRIYDEETKVEICSRTREIAKDIEIIFKLPRD